MDERIILVVDPSFELSEMHRQVAELQKTVAELKDRQRWLEGLLREALSPADVRRRAVRLGQGR